MSALPHSDRETRRQPRRGLVRHYSVYGPADAPTLLFVHGTRRTRAMWRHQIAVLSATHRVIAVDLPGHGTRAHEPFSFACAIRSLRLLIEREAGGRVVVVGSSLGGYVAMELALAHPDYVADWSWSAQQPNRAAWLVVPC